MSKKQINLSDSFMDRIHREHITMRPKWYFVFGSLSMVLGISGSAVMSAFLVSLISFSLRTHGPMGSIRYQQLLTSFPWWAPFLALVGLGIGILLLRKYDFSYKKNFTVIVLGFILAIFISGWLLDSTGIDTIWMRRGPMWRLYQQYDGGAQRGNRMIKDTKSIPSSRIRHWNNTVSEENN